MQRRPSASPDGTLRRNPSKSPDRSLRRNISESPSRRLSYSPPPRQDRPSNPPEPPLTLLHSTRSRNARDAADDLDDDDAHRGRFKSTRALLADTNSAWVPFSGIVKDIRRRLPYYVSDWLDAWNYRVIPSTWVGRHASQLTTVHLLRECASWSGVLVGLDRGYGCIRCAGGSPLLSACLGGFTNPSLWLPLWRLCLAVNRSSSPG